MRSFYTLDDKDKKYVLDNYKYYTNRELAEYIGNGCNKNHVAKFLKDSNIKKGKKGIPQRKNRIFSKEDDEYICNNYLIMKYSDIGKHLGYSEKQIRGRIYNLGLRKTRCANDYFHEIDSSDKAYFLGFIYADGWIVFNETNHKYEFGFELQSQDKYILEILNDKLGNKNIISHKNPSVENICGIEAYSGDSDVLRIYNKSLVTDLMSNGIETNKSSKDTYPIVSNQFFFDFLRGYIDGDGCYYNNKNITYMHITSASEVPLKYIQSKLRTFDIETKIYYCSEKKHRLMCTNKNEMIKLVNKLYYSDNIICLNRKYKLIEHYISHSIQ